MDPQEYASLLEFYDTSFRNIAEGEVVKGTVVKVTPTEVIVDVGFKSEGIIPIEEFIDETGQVTAQPGDTVDVLARAHRGPRRLRRPLAREGREDEDLGRGREGLPGPEGRHRPRHRTHQGRTGRGHRRPRVPAGIADRRAAGAEPRRAARAGAPDARHQGEQEARQHRAVPQGPARRRKRREEEDDARHAGGRQVAPRHRQEPHRLRRVHRSRRHRRPAAHHGHVVGPRDASVGSRARRRRNRRHRAQSTIRAPSASRSATSRSCPIRGATSSSGTRSASA